MPPRPKMPREWYHEEIPPQLDRFVKAAATPDGEAAAAAAVATAIERAAGHFVPAEKYRGEHAAKSSRQRGTFFGTYSNNKVFEGTAMGLRTPRR